jgi:transcriptional regulator with XRE-family HTH domain
MMANRSCDLDFGNTDGGLSCATRSFGELLFLARRARQHSLRRLADKAGVSASAINEFENGRRPPPNGAVVAKLASALQLPSEEEQLLFALALEERTGLGLRVARTTPRHVADLLRDIACLGQQLSPAQVRSIRQTLEVAMK